MLHTYLSEEGLEERRALELGIWECISRHRASQDDDLATVVVAIPQHGATCISFCYSNFIERGCYHIFSQVVIAVKYLSAQRVLRMLAIRYVIYESHTKRPSSLYNNSSVQCYIH